MKVLSIIYKYFIHKDLQSIFSVELINYLNRFINHENLYDIYSEDSKSEKIDSKTSVMGPHDRYFEQEISSFYNS